MLLPVSTTLAPGLRFPRSLATSRPGGVSGIKTISIPVSQTSMTMPRPLYEKVQDPVDTDTVAAAEVTEASKRPPPVDPEAAEEERKARKAAAAREKRKRKKEASKAAARAVEASAATRDAADSETEAAASQSAAPTAVTAVVEDAELPSEPFSPTHGANLTDSGTGSSDGKASGVSTPASSHGFPAPQRSLDWASLDKADEIPNVSFENGPKSSSHVASEPSKRSPYAEKAVNEPPYTPRSGKFWGHDERHLEGDARGGGGWRRGPSSPTPADRAPSPHTGSSDGGWQEVTKHPQSRALREKAATKGKQLSHRDRPVPSTWSRPDYRGSGGPSGMRAWADEEKDVPEHKSEPIVAVPPTDVASRPPEPPWTARSPVPYLFNVPGSRSYVDDSTKKRTIVLRVNLTPSSSTSARSHLRTSERTVVSNYRLPAQSHPHPLATVDQPLRISASAGKSLIVHRAATERKRLADEQVAKAARDAAEQAEAERRKAQIELERAKQAAEERARIEGEQQAAREAAALHAQLEDQRRLEAAQETLAAAVPQPLVDEESSGLPPIASTSSLPPGPHAAAHSSPGPVASPTQEDVQSNSMYAAGAPPHLPPSSMFPPGPFVFAEGMGPPGLHIFDHSIGMVVPIDPTTAANLRLMPSPSLHTSRGQTSTPADYVASPPPRPAFFAPARSSRIEIRAPIPGQTSPRAQRRTGSSSLRSQPQSPTSSRYDTDPAMQPAIDERMIPGSFSAGGAVYFAPPVSDAAFYHPQHAFYGPPPTSEMRSPDVLDPAILSVGSPSGPLHA